MCGCSVYFIILRLLLVFSVIHLNNGEADGLNTNSRPNIIVIIADDVGWNDVSFHGSDQISTPNIDALGYHGVVFQRHYAQQVCTPSRAAFLTGQYPIRFGYQGYPLGLGLHKYIPHNLKTLPQSLKNLGYKTHLIGKWHLGHGKKSHTPMGYGYDTHYGYWNGYIGYFDHSVGGFDTYNGIDLHDQFEPVTDKTGQYVTDLFTNRALDIINNHSTSNPLHLVVSHLAGHTGKTIKGIETILEVKNITETNEKYRYIKDINRRMYTEILERMDDSVGKVVEALAKRNILNDSIIAFFSDNGAPTFGMHGNTGSNFPLKGIKMTMYEGAVRTPAILYSSLIKNKGKMIDKLFHITDWTPTLITAAGGDIKQLGVIDGIDQWANIVEEKSTNLRKELLIDIDHKFKYAAYIGYDGRYKLVNNSYFDYNYTGEEGFKNAKLHFKKVEKSLTNTYLKGLTNLTHDLAKIEELRIKMTIKCSPRNMELREKTVPCTDFCLYDLWEDPCEFYNIADDHPEIVKNLWNKLQTLEKQALPKPVLTFDTRADPKLCNHTWFNWLDTDGCWYHHQ